MKHDGRLSLRIADQTTEGTLLAPEKLIPGILFIHGWGGSQEQDLKKAEEIAQLGCLCFTFDLRGHAATERHRNEVTREDGIADVVAAYDFLASQEIVDRSAIAVVGTSYGGYLATLLTELRPVNWLALRVPALYPDSNWSTPKALLNRQKILGYRRTFRGSGRNRSLRACSKFTGDVLIVESERDELVPHQAVASFMAAFRHTHSLSYRVIKGADHALRDETCRKAYHDLLIAWIGEMVRGARRSGSQSRQ
jgi:hypothetical protein